MKKRLKINPNDLKSADLVYVYKLCSLMSQSFHVTKYVLNKKWEKHMINSKLFTHHSLFNFIINGNNIGSRGTVKKQRKDMKKNE